MSGASRDSRVPVEKHFSQLKKAAISNDSALIDRLLTPNTVNGGLPDADLNETD